MRNLLGDEEAIIPLSNYIHASHRFAERITEKAQSLEGIWFERMFHNSSKGLEGLIIVKASIGLRLKGLKAL